MSDSLRPHELQHARLPRPSLSPGVCSNSCPLSWWCHPTISSCHPLLLLPLIFLRIWVFSNELSFPIRWPKYWSFSFIISPSNEYSGSISFRIDWFDLLAVQGTLKSLFQHHNSKASKVVFCGGLTFSWDKKRSESPMRKGKIYPSECRVPKNSKER